LWFHKTKIENLLNVCGVVGCGCLTVGHGKIIPCLRIVLNVAHHIGTNIGWQSMKIRNLRKDRYWLDCPEPYACQAYPFCGEEHNALNEIRDEQVKGFPLTINVCDNCLKRFKKKRDQ
jgi:hypothetical protein